MTSLPPQQDNRFGGLFLNDSEISLLSYRQQPPHQLTQNHHYYPQHHIPGHPMIYPVPQTSNELKTGSVSNSDIRSHDALIHQVEVPTLFQSYDNTVSAARLSQVFEEGGADNVGDSINMHHTNSISNNPLDANKVGWVGAAGGGISNGESGGPYASDSYKGGPDDNRNTHGDRDIGRAGIETTCEADVKKNDMGNDLFSARGSSVSDARAESPVVLNKMGHRTDKARSNQGMYSLKNTEARVVDKPCDTLHTVDSLSDTHVSTCVVSTKLDTVKFTPRTEKWSSALSVDVDDLNLTPALNNIWTRVDEETLYISSIPENSITCQETIRRISENGESVNLAAVFESLTDVTGSTDQSSSSQLEKGTSTLEIIQANLQPASVVKCQGHEQSVIISTASSNPTASRDTETAACVSLECASLTDGPTIIAAPNIPRTTPLTSSSLISISDETVRAESQPESSEILKNETEILESHNVTTQDVHAASVSTEENHIKGSDKKLTKSAPVGGVKVLPSTFQFNFRSFRETNKEQQRQTSPITSPKTATVYPASALETQGQIAGTSKDVITSGLSTAGTTAVIVSSVTTKPDSEHLPTNTQEDITVSKETEEENMNHYAVPSDLTIDTSGFKSNSGKSTISNPNDRRTNTISNGGIVQHFKKDTENSFQNSNARVSTHAEEIYAVPIPKSQRQPGIIRADGSRVTLPLVHNAQAHPQIKQLQSPLSNAASLFDDGDDDAFDDVVMRKTGHPSSQMKKSTTTDMLDAYSSDCSNIPYTGSRKYDYFSLGRRPKRPRIRTLTDSKGMAVSLDMLLRSRRQSSVEVSSTGTTEQALSVDDILRSCIEFDENCAFYPPGSNNAGTVRNLSLHPLSFSEASHVKLCSETNGGVKSGARHVSRTNRPILKKSQSCGTKKEISKPRELNQDHVTLAAIQTTQTIDFVHAKETAASVNGCIISKSFSETQAEIVEGTQLSPKTATAGVNGKDRNESAPVGESQYKTAGRTPTVPSSDSSSRSEITRKPDIVKSYIVPRTEGSTDNDCPSANCEKSNIPQDHTKHNSHDEPLKGGPPVSAAVLATEIIYTHPIVEENYSAAVVTKDVKPFETQGTGAPVSLTLVSEKINPSLKDITISTTKVSIIDTNAKSLPDSTSSISTNSQEAIISSDTSKTVSSHVDSTSILEPQSLYRDFRDLDSSSSDIPSPPLSVSVCSDSTSVSSPGVMSSLSVDIAESPPPAQRSPNINAKLEAAEALKWLRAAGFPQYAQMFDDGQFPVDMGVVEKDHDFLDKDSLQSLFRRLETLNKYAGSKLGAHPCKKAASEEDDEDDFCALSERWEYQKSARRWSRKDITPSSQKAAVVEKDKRELATRSGSHDSLLADQDSESQTGDSPLLESKMPHQSVEQPQGRIEMWSLSQGGHAAAEISPEGHDETDSPTSPRLRRAASERMKTAKNLFKKMEGLKSTKSRRHRNIVEISGPVVADRENMQAKLERLNCVDILQTTETLPGSKSPSGDDGHYALHNKSSPQSPTLVSSPRPSSDFMLRPREVSYPKSSHFTNSNQTQSTHKSPKQHSSLGHDSSFDEYYQAHTTFLQNLQSTQGGTSAETVRKNNSDTNLMEIFLVPQDHQPGRFPRMLQNGYIETEACGTAVNARTGSVRLGRGTGISSDRKNANSRVAQSPGAPGEGYRVSLYDNFLPAEGKRLEERDSLSAISKVTELGASTGGNEVVGSSYGKGAQNSIGGLIVDVNSDSSQPDSTNISRGSSVPRITDSVSDQLYRSSIHDRSVSFESSSSSQTPQNSIVSNEGGVTSNDSRDGRKSSPDSLSSPSKGVSHSSSVGSYFHGGSSHSEVPSKDVSENTPDSSFQNDYDEFDRILQELYRNINDLTSFMDKDKNERAPKLVRASTSPLPAGINKHSLVHVATPSTRPILRSQRPVFDADTAPSPATSDLVHSSAPPRSPQEADFYRVLDLDNENSSSGGEGSNTAESGSEDQEAVLTDASHDDSLEQIIEVSRERRDSGVGHSLTRAPSDRRRKKIRWHSFQKSHRPDISSRAMQINSLTVGQLVRLQKLSLLKLTGIMEKCLPVNKSGWNWMLPRFMKRHKAPDFSDRSVFGVPLSVMAQRTGQPMPQCVLYAMRYLRRTCQSAVGIFRKSGVKSKIQQLRDYLESHPDTTNFDGENAYNVADMLKTYFRDLPECLLTNKMSETFRSIYTYVPQSQRLEAIQAAILLLPDENREVLQSILLFLSDIAAHEADHQMNASNLAVCFTPTVFHLGPRQSVPYSPKRNRKNSSGVPDPREILEQKAAHECLLMMILDCKKLFTVPFNLFRQLQVQSLAHMEPTLPQVTGNSPSDVRAFGQERIQIVLKEAHDKNRGWIPTMTVGDVEVFHRKPIDDCPLKEWKLVVDIEAPPIEVLRRIMHERHTWDEDLLSWSVVERLDPHSDIFQFVLNSMAPHPPRNFCVLRYWRSDLNKGACALITTSVEHTDALEIHGVWAIDLGTYFLMEPCGSGRSRLMYITRVDTRGRMPEWYTKIFGHICANFLERLKESFKQDTSGPETKV